MRGLIQHSIILTDKFTSHTLWVWATVSNHIYQLIFRYSKVVEHQNLTKKPKYKKHYNIKHTIFNPLNLYKLRHFFYYYFLIFLFQIDKWQNVGRFLYNKFTKKLHSPHQFILFLNFIPKAAKFILILLSIPFVRTYYYTFNRFSYKYIFF